MTVSLWAGVKLSLHLSCVTKWASPKNRPARCKRLLQTVVYPCPFNLSLSKSTAEWVWLCHAYPPQRRATHARCPPRDQHVVLLPPISPTAEGASPMLVPKWHVQGEDNSHNHVGSAVHPDTVNRSEWHQEGQQQVWVGPAQSKPTTGASNPFMVLHGSQ